MTAPDVGRRRLIRGLGAAVGLGVIGGVSWRILGGDAAEPTPPAMTTTAPSLVSEGSTIPPSPSRSSPSPTTVGGSPTTVTTPAVSTIRASAELVVIGREGWGAAPIDGELVPHVVERLTVHHTAARLERPETAPAALRGHQTSHQLERGWPDLAYHFVIDGAGNVYEGRDIAGRGDTATAYDPTGHLLVCCEGDFDSQPLPAMELEALVTVLAWASAHFDVDPSTIAGHRDYAATRCPGTALTSLIDDGTLEAGVAALVAAGPIALRTLIGAAARRAVAAIESNRG